MTDEASGALSLGQPQLIGKRLGVAVSGGSDSLALLHLLRDQSGAELQVVTVNHGLRPDAASEALHVERVCADLGVPHTILEWRGWDGKGNLQDQARRNRYGLIADWARTRELDAVAVGHTLDDQAETFLLRLARSSGVDGLSGMRDTFQFDGVAFVRPLLAVTRDALRAYLRDRGIRWVEDPSNEDESFDRVKARRALDALRPLGLTERILADVSRNLGEARFALSKVASDWADSHVRVISGDVVIDRTALTGLPVELSRRILSGALRWVASEPYPPRRKSLGALLDAVRTPDAVPQITVHGCIAMISTMTVRITREYAAVARVRTSASEVWDSRWRLDGPAAPGLEIRALGEALANCPDWRATKLPRLALLASPSVWQGTTLVSAPLAGFGNDWSAKCGDSREFAAFLIAH